MDGRVGCHAHATGLSVGRDRPKQPTGVHQKFQPLPGYADTAGRSCVPDVKL